MLHFVLGTAGVGKTKYLYDTVCELAKAQNQKLMFIVPDQSSFETEKNFLDILGPRLSQNIKVFGFSRLCDYVFDSVGNRFLSFADDGICNVCMSIAIEQVGDKLDLFRKRASFTDLTELMLNSVKEYKKCSITPDMLYEASKRATDEALKKKLYETALVYEAYNAVIAQSYIDPSDRLTRVTDILASNALFEGYTIAVDSFYGFTKQEYDLIEVLLRQCYDMYFALTTDNSETDLFFAGNRTKKTLTRIAHSNSIPVKNPLYLKENHRTKCSDLISLADNAFRIQKNKAEESDNSLVLYEAKSIYDEADFVARTIKKLVMEDDLEYRDIAVITRSIDKYTGVLDIAFDKYSISYFMDNPQSITAKPLIKFICSSFEFITGGYGKDDLLSLLKTGLTDISVEETANLENYLFVWDISSKRLFEEFTDNPRGFSDSFSDSDTALLNEIEHTRSTALNALKDFYFNTKETTGVNIAKAVMKLIHTLNVKENILKMCDELDLQGELELSKEQIRLYNTFVEILDKMVSVIGDYSISAKRFYELLKINLSNTDISFIPRSVDRVDIACADRSLPQEKKVVFLIGAIEGEFPHTPVESGVFSDLERKLLADIDITLTDNIEQLVMTEKLLAYNAMCLPKEKLYISYYNTSLSGDQCTKSAIITEAQSCVKDITVLSDLNMTIYDRLYSEASAFEYYVKNFKNAQSQELTSLSQYFNEDSKYSDIILSLNEACKKQPMRITDNSISEKLFGKDMYLSASQVEKFHMCKFEYFCDYGLRIKQRRKAKIDALEYGTLMHYVLETFIKNHKSQDFSLITEEDIDKEVSDILDYYLSSHLGTKENKSKRFLYLYYSMKSTISAIIVQITRELSQSSFKPVDFELNIGEDIDCYTLKLSDGIRVRIRGSVDRVDLMEIGDKKYIRVIDYKTGTKKYNLSDIMYGINLQMLIYMSAINSDTSQRYGSCVLPAGVLYMPAVSKKVSADITTTEEEIKDEKSKSYTMFGIVLDDMDVISGMEKDLSGRYIPVKSNGKDIKKKDSLATLEEFGAMFAKVDELIGKMALSLKNGDVSAVPAKNLYDACEYCPYGAICRYTDGDECKNVEKIEKEEMMNELIDKSLEAEVN